MSLSGKTCLITGANSGLGFATAKQLAGLGAKVVMVCRSMEKGKDAAGRIMQEVPDASLELMLCDLSSLDSIAGFIDVFRKTHTKLDLLFNNAALMKRKRELTSDGLEMMFQVNYLAPVILTLSLLDLLKDSSPSRIVNIAVPPQKMRLDFENLQLYGNYNGFDAFFRTKLPLLLFSLELSKKMAGTGVTVNITDPGPGKFKSNITREIPKFLAWMVDLFAIPADKAAETIVYLASSEEVAEKTGCLYSGKKEAPLIPYWEDASDRERLWTYTVQLLESKKISIPGIDPKTSLV